MKVYRISGDDYSAMQFKMKYTGLLMRDVARELLGEEGRLYTYKVKDDYWELSIQGEITDSHSYKIGKSLQDYDDSKHTDLIVEDEIICQ